MGLLRAAEDALVGVLADQWKDFYTVPDGLKPTSALFAAVPRRTNAGRGANLDASQDVITNGSVIVVPEGYGLLLMQDGAITGFAAEPGAYIWNSDAQDSASVFAGNGIVSPLITTSWERFKFGGRPQSQQRAFFVSLKELPNNRFATPAEIYWDDAYIGSQVGALTRGSYTLKITDPILFIRNFVPAKYLQSGVAFDFTDLDNDAAGQLFNEVISSLSPAFARYSNAPGMGNRITRIQQDSAGFALSLSAEVEQSYRWRSERGLEMTSTAIVSIEYDESSREVLRAVQRADALSGSRGNANLQASVAAGFQAAGTTDGASGILGLGIASGAVGLDRLQQPTTAPPPAAAPTEDDAFTRLSNLKKLLDAGLIEQSEYDAVKARILGL
jgi:membrane protease subunit (stomatin/prohibitin family)